MGIDTVRMIVSVTAVRTRAFDQVDSVAQVDDFLLLFDFAQQRGCLGVGSNVSGLAPAGTSTSTSKSPPTMLSTRLCSGCIETYKILLFCRLFVMQAVSSTIADRYVAILRMIDNQCFLVTIQR